MISKYRRKGLHGQLGKHLALVVKTLAAQKECHLEEGQLLPDHVHLLIDTPPQYSGASVVGYSKGKGPISLARTSPGHRLHYGGQHFWAPGSYLSPGGREEKTARGYIKKQEEHDRNLDQWRLFDRTPHDPS